MEMPEKTVLHSCAVELTKKASEVSEKIKAQSAMLESIQVQVDSNSQVFKRNQGVFFDALDRLDRDKRNVLMMFLFLVVFLLVYMLKS